MFALPGRYDNHHITLLLKIITPFKIYGCQGWYIEELCANNFLISYQNYYRAQNCYQQIISTIITEVISC